MSISCPSTRTHVLRALAVCVAVGQVGCHAIDFYDKSLQAPDAPANDPALEPPRELRMTSLPSYVIEPPDILQIEMLKQVPLPPYHIEAYDVLSINAAPTVPGFPIGPLDDEGEPTPNGGMYLVEMDGRVDFGPMYGWVKVVGLTLDEATEAIRKHLDQIIFQPDVSVQLARASGMQPVTGEYLVGPDGTVNLRQYGSVHVAGKTIAEAKLALNEHLAQYFDSPKAAINVGAYNSKFYYIVTQGAGLGDNLVKVPITGNETLLDAIAQVGGLSQLSSKDIWIARSAPAGFGCQQILPIDWDGIARDASTATNYQIMPDDRIYIAENPIVALTNTIGKVTGPFERIAGISSLGASTIRGLQTLGRNYNRLRR